MKDYKTKTMPHLEYRFNIRERLGKVNPIKAKNIKDFVIQKSGRSKVTVYRVINQRLKTDCSIDLNILLAFAEAFNCSIEDLQNPR